MKQDGELTDDQITVWNKLYGSKSIKQVNEDVFNLPGGQEIRVSTYKIPNDGLYSVVMDKKKVLKPHEDFYVIGNFIKIPGYKEQLKCSQTNVKWIE